MQPCRLPLLIMCGLLLVGLLASPGLAMQVTSEDTTSSVTVGWIRAAIDEDNCAKGCCVCASVACDFANCHPLTVRDCTPNPNGAPCLVNPDEYLCCVWYKYQTRYLGACRTELGNLQLYDVMSADSGTPKDNKIIDNPCV